MNEETKMTTVRDSGESVDENGLKAYEVVRDGEVVRTMRLSDYDANMYAKAMGFEYIQPAGGGE